ncbi:hypothetical protein A3D80_03000 [Candidatus Roizmanbacteria bacterium RIFCSPHIGHO2_02_FULL_40_13b]|nr:MAG: hypothetical protein A3D80_03000 [Candidatus Roizmanbacteria bacterium RIFCSPHIGHO2_02_FULL_40_13b]
MKTEYFLTGAVGLVIFGYVLDILSGPLSLTIGSPFEFLTPVMLSTYPFTAVSVGVKTVAIFISIVITITSLGENKYSLQSVVVFILAALMELFAIQQIATHTNNISLQWNLSLAFSGVILVIPAIIYMILAIIKTAHKNLIADPYETDSDEEA